MYLGMYMQSKHKTLIYWNVNVLQQSSIACKFNWDHLYISFTVHSADILKAFVMLNTSQQQQQQQQTYLLWSIHSARYKFKDAK